MEKHRNLDYLEHELDKYRVSEEERKEEHDKKLKKMRERLLKEEVCMRLIIHCGCIAHVVSIYSVTVVGGSHAWRERLDQ
jgi:hypothetical protein